MASWEQAVAMCADCFPRDLVMLILGIPLDCTVPEAGFLFLRDTFVQTQIICSNRYQSVKSACVVSIPLAICVGVLSHRSSAVMGEELCAGLVSWLSKAESIAWQS